MTKMYLFFYFVNIYVKHVEDRDFLFSSVLTTDTNSNWTSSGHDRSTARGIFDF